jgi:hypothetical protein
MHTASEKQTLKLILLNLLFLGLLTDLIKTHVFVNLLTLVIKHYFNVIVTF